MAEDKPECIENHTEQCRGRVEYRMALSGTGVSHPRCDGHWEKRLELEDRLRRGYPDTDTPPDWFDPAYAGERWNPDD